MKRFLTILFFTLASTWTTATAHAGEENGFWADDVRLIAKTTSSSVEFGFDGNNRYITLDGWNRRYARHAGSDLGYQSSYPGSGRTQWIAFDFIGTNFFGSGSNPAPVIQGIAHIPIFLRNRSFYDWAGIVNAEGKGIFLGRNDIWGNCGAPADKGRIFFETRVVRSQAPSEAVAGVKCADGYSDKYFVDGQQYRVVVHANDTHLAYWVYLKNWDGSTTLWSSNGTEALDYPSYSPGDYNSAFVNAKSSWLPGEHSRMNNNNLDTATIALPLTTSNAGAWNLKITNLGSGRF